MSSRSDVYAVSISLRPTSYGSSLLGQVAFEWDTTTLACDPTMPSSVYLRHARWTWYLRVRQACEISTGLEEGLPRAVSLLRAEVSLASSKQHARRISAVTGTAATPRVRHESREEASYDWSTTNGEIEGAAARPSRGQLRHTRETGGVA